MVVKSFLKLLQPSTVEFVVTFLFTMLILVISNSSTIFFSIVGNSENATLQTLVRQYTHQLTFQSSDVFGRITTLLLWGFIGAVVYVLAWLAINAYISVRNDLVIGTFFVRPVNSRRQYWFDTVGRLLLRLGAAIMLLFLVLWTMIAWLPASIELFHRYLAYIGILPYARTAIVAILGWLVILHLMVVLLRVVLLRIRIFGADEAK